MSLKPSSDEDGPVLVTYQNGMTEQWDRIWHTSSGMVHLYDVDESHTLPSKGESAKLVPVSEIKKIVFENYWPN